MTDFIVLDPVFPALDMDAAVVGADNSIPLDKIVRDVRGSTISFTRQHDPVLVKIVEVIVQDFIVLAMHVNSITFAKQSDMVGDFKPHHPDVVRRDRKPLRHGPAACLKGYGMVWSARASYMDALRVIAFGDQDRIAGLGGFGSLLDSLPGSIHCSAAGIASSLGVNVKGTGRCR
jgi:hypothetical protein